MNPIHKRPEKQRKWSIRLKGLETATARSGTTRATFFFIIILSYFYKDRN
jgi:hypothetical protein